MLAVLVDLLILLVILTPLELAIFGSDYPTLAMEGKTAGIDLTIQLVVVIAAVLFWRYASATPGLMAIGAKIVNAKTLGSPSTGQLTVRAIVLILLAVLVIPLIALVWIAFDKRKQGLHDKIAGTVVIYDEE